jgi:hypothetical protein
MTSRWKFIKRNVRVIITTEKNSSCVKIEVSVKRKLFKIIPYWELVELTHTYTIRQHQFEQTAKNYCYLYS